ncbi:16S rRNA (uracil(1498)-N(3))-methyltransferase [Aestuariivivens sediminis]|uniref:16S rRNA (uracil(1498)-N(3))-methyltransferase n=1 Tax=Aestuariivivens sediminis TaxID=2913557 RepID=UPI001F57B580|nr:16S rRNA (uracil(1498)-N(3))-methyltransferase [Aestuariivivens sediminis]
MQLFYHPDIVEDTNEFYFDKVESRHITKVLRKNTGDHLQITNGNGWLFTAQILLSDVKKCKAQVIDKTLQNKRPYTLHMAVAPTKINERYEWFLEKATEIGVDIITPIICDHSERKVIKTERYEKILQSAMKQSLHSYLPELNDPISFRDFMAQSFEGTLLIAHCEATERKRLKQEITPKNKTTILIGPEGDFSAKEIQMAIENNFIPVTLGSSRLRTETAAIVACHSIAFINQ